MIVCFYVLFRSDCLIDLNQNGFECLFLWATWVSHGCMASSWLIKVDHSELRLDLDGSWSLTQDDGFVGGPLVNPQFISLLWKRSFQMKGKSTNSMNGIGSPCSIDGKWPYFTNLNCWAVKGDSRTKTITHLVGPLAPWTGPNPLDIRLDSGISTKRTMDFG